MNLQNRITASQVRVKMEAIAIIPQVDTHAAARMITLGTRTNKQTSRDVVFKNYVINILLLYMLCMVT